MYIISTLIVCVCVCVRVHVHVCVCVYMCVTIVHAYTALATYYAATSSSYTCMLGIGITSLMINSIMKMSIAIGMCVYYLMRACGSLVISNVKGMFGTQVLSILCVVHHRWPSIVY